MHHRILVAKVVCSAVFAASIGLAAMLVAVPRATGGAWLNVLSGSMGSAIPAGSLVLVKPVDPVSIRPGDVITWQVRPGEAIYVTHRVVRVEDGAGPLAFVTRGDANRSADSAPVPAGSVRGKVTGRIPYLGAAGALARGPLGIATLVIAGGAAGLFRLRRRASMGTHPAGEDAASPRPVETSPRATAALIVAVLLASALAFHSAAAGTNAAWSDHETVADNIAGAGTWTEGSP